jgi:chromosome segregation ATPase
MMNDFDIVWDALWLQGPVSEAVLAFNRIKNAIVQLSEERDEHQRWRWENERLRNKAVEKMLQAEAERDDFKTKWLVEAGRHTDTQAERDRLQAQNEAMAVTAEEQAYRVQSLKADRDRLLAMVEHDERQINAVIRERDQLREGVELLKDEVAMVRQSLGESDRERDRLLSEVKSLRYEMSKRPWTFGDDERAELQTEIDRLREQYAILRDTFLSSNWYVQPACAPKGFASIREAIDRVQDLEGGEA